ncbi:hypothetical protein D3C80_1298290 [compost metagenome]
MAVQAVSQDQAGEIRNLDLVVRGFSLHVGDAEQDQRHAFTWGIAPVPFHRRDFRRLVLESIEAVHVADQHLQGRSEQQHPQGHGEHPFDRWRARATQHVPGRGGANEQCRRQHRGGDHVRQAIRERRVEDDGEPVHGHHHAIDDFMPLRRLHPAVGGQDPGGRDHRADGDHDRGEEVQPTADLVPAKQHHTQEAGFQEEGGEHLVGQ